MSHKLKYRHAKYKIKIFQMKTMKKFKKILSKMKELNQIVLKGTFV